MTSGEDEEADVYRRSTPFLDAFIVYLHAFSKNLPSCTGQIVVVFCVLPISVSAAVFLITAIFNFGVALIAQTISTLVILVLLIPCLALCLVSAIATAYLLQLGHSIYLRLTCPPSRSTMNPPMITSKLEIEEKLKTL